MSHSKANNKTKPHGLFFAQHQILVNTQTNNVMHPLEETQMLLARQWKTMLKDQHLTFIDCSHIGINDKDSALQFMPLKQYLRDASLTLTQTLLRAHHLIIWHSNTRFCSRCQNPLEMKTEPHVKYCSLCQLQLFPNYSPAVMVLIHDHERLLLARSPHFNPGVYSAVAGFIEPGESAEMAAVREVKEELGLDIGDLSYFASQPWPFPDSFMIAYKTQQFSGDLKLCPEEIEDAQWFYFDKLPQLPSKASISRRLIDSVIEEYS